MVNENESNLKREVEKEEELDELEEGIEDSSKLKPWNKQITVRSVVASILIGCIFSVIAMKLNLTTGITPNLNVSAALLAFIIITTWNKLLEKFGIVSVPFSKQENTMIQTCVVACYSIAVGGGFGSYLLGMNTKTFELSGGTSILGNTSSSIKEPGIGWMTGYLFLVCFIGLFVLIPLRKILIIDYKLTFPSGMATAVLINGFHNRGDKLAKKQVRGFLKAFSSSFLWGFFQWFYTAKEECGFQQFPTFGLQARKQTFYFDFSLTYVGTGMICPHIVNLSLLLGAVLSYGVMWPLIRNLRGEWFPADIPESSMKSVNGYRVFISIALLLGDGLYNFVNILRVTITNFHTRLTTRNHNSDGASPEQSMSVPKCSTMPSPISVLLNVAAANKDDIKVPNTNSMSAILANKVEPPVMVTSSVPVAATTMLSLDSFAWCKLDTTGQLLPPRDVHTTVSFGNNLFVFGGFSNEQNLYDDVHVLDLEWTKVVAVGEGTSGGRFFVAGQSLDPQMAGVLVFIGGCNKYLDALNDMYFLHTGLSREVEREEQRYEKLSLRKQLKLKCPRTCHISTFQI